MRARACVCAYLIIFSARFIGHFERSTLSLQFRKIKSKKMFSPGVCRTKIATLLRALGISSGTVYRRKPDGFSRNAQIKINN